MTTDICARLRKVGPYIAAPVFLVAGAIGGGIAESIIETRSILDDSSSASATSSAQIADDLDHAYCHGMIAGGTVTLALEVVSAFLYVVGPSIKEIASNGMSSVRNFSLWSRSSDSTPTEMTSLNPSPTSPRLSSRKESV